MIPDIIIRLGIPGSYKLDRQNPFYGNFTQPNKDLVLFLVAQRTTGTVNIVVIFGRY
jgi:hypothetical protein